MRPSLKIPGLHRYWFPAAGGLGIGVTAFSIDEARRLARHALRFMPHGAVLGEPELDVDVSTLDPAHVLPNMGPPNFRGVWFPNIGLPASDLYEQ